MSERLRALVTLPGAMAAAWFIAAFVGIVWTWGKNPLAFPSPDEAVNRLATKLIDQRGVPFLRAPFDDPEDLLHPRFWVNLGDHAVPAYAPVALYVYAFIAKIPFVGLWLIPMLPASAVAACTAGTARLLPPSRRWLAMLTPSLALPALYWLLRPWMNISLLLVCLCWAIFCWSAWRASDDGKTRTRWLAAALFLVGGAAAVRPDYAAYLMSVALLCTLAESEGRWKAPLLLVCGAGVMAVIANLVLNWVITGHPLRAAYQIFMERQPEGAGRPFLPGILNSLLTPMGLHTPDETWQFFLKYCLKMRPMGILVLGQLSLVPLLIAAPPRKKVFYGAAIAVMIGFAITRFSTDVFGAKVSTGYVHHSVPRYMTPVYLLAALPPVLFLARCRVGVTMVFGTILAGLLAVRSVYEITVHQPQSLRYLRGLAAANEKTLDAVAEKVPSRAFVYTNTQDKILWFRWRVGVISDPKSTATSMRRAVDEGLAVYFVQWRYGSGQLRKLGQALKSKHLNLKTLDAKRGIYRLQKIAPAAPPPDDTDHEHDVEPPKPPHDAPEDE